MDAFSIKGHFDGRAVVLDEPFNLQVGQQVRVFAETAIEDQSPKELSPAEKIAALRKLQASFNLTPEQVDAWCRDVRAERDAWPDRTGQQ